MKFSKGFIGPIGDDLPSLVMVVLALTLFFSGIVFCLNSYNQKIDNMHILTGSMDISRIITKTAFIPDPIPSGMADGVAQSYGLHYDVYFESVSGGPSNCPAAEDAYVFKFFVAKASGGVMSGLDTLVLRVCR